jgi:hypothetical protein
MEKCLECGGSEFMRAVAIVEVGRNWLFGWLTGPIRMRNVGYNVCCVSCGEIFAVRSGGIRRIRVQKREESNGTVSVREKRPADMDPIELTRTPGLPWTRNR